MKLVHALILLASGMVVVGENLAWADDYPTRPVTLIAPWPAGGGIDAICRMLGTRLADRLGKPVVIDNRPGAGSTMGVAAAARAASDGYTLVLSGSVGFATSVAVYKKLPYDPTKDFAPVARVADIPFVLLVHPSLPVRSVQDLIKLAKEKPDQLSYASGGPGSPQHLFAELFKGMAGFPYKGNAPALNDVVAGHVAVMFSEPATALPLIREGKLRALGVSSMIRLASAPEIPPIAEAGVPGYEAVAWIMIAAPAGTPQPIVAKLHTELTSIVELPEIHEQMVKFGVIPVSGHSSEELQPFINAEIVRWGKVVHKAGIAGSQ